MHEKNLDVCLLLDFYGDLLPEKQRMFLDCYYNEDLYLAEIAEIYGLSRQGVLSVIKKARDELFVFEEKLRLKQKYYTAGNMAETANEHIKALYAMPGLPPEYCIHLKKIEEIIDMLSERKDYVSKSR